MLIKVRRDNVILQIEDDADNIQRYLDKGYSLIDQKTEEVIKEAIPHDVNELRALVIKQNKTIEELRAKLNAGKEPPAEKTSKRSKKKD